MRDHLVRRAHIATSAIVSTTSGGLAASSATLVPAWWQDYVIGDDANSGQTPSQPVRTVAEIARRWRNGIAGARPFIPVSTTIHIGSSVPPGPNQFSDPLFILADVDVAAGVVISVVPTTSTIKRSSALTAIANPFARTPSGRLAVTDLAVVDWSSDVDQLFIDTTQGATSWVTEASGGNGILSSVRPSVPSGSAIDPDTGLGATVTVGATDAYEIVTPLSVYFGSSARIRQFPSSTLSGISAIVFQHLRGLAQSPFEICIVSGDVTFAGASQSGALVEFIECRLDQSLSSLAGGLFVLNCAVQTSLVLGGASSFSGALAGYARGNVTMGASPGEVAVDQDFTTFSRDGFFLIGNSIFLGNLAAYNPLIASALTVAQASAASLAPNYDPEAVAYGSVSGGVMTVQELGDFRYDSASAASSFVFNVSSFMLGGQTSSFGFDEATGLYVGPTSNTLAHLDAPLGAGTGFGGVAIDPRRCSVFGTSQ